MKQTVKRPYILVTNDDGIEAKGICKLIEFLRPVGDLVVFAPVSSRSGASSAITTAAGIKIQLLSEEEGLTRYSCDGTPVDCVKVAMNSVLSRRPDIVISGINHGHNAAISVIYSGTMGAAAEGAVFNIPSVGFSLDDYSPDADFECARKVVAFVCEKILEEPFPPGTYLNVNIPSVATVKGIMPCSQAKGRWENEFREEMNDAGEKRFFFSGEFIPAESQLPTNDVAWLKKGYATVVPCKIDVTDYSMLSKMASMETSSLNE